MSLHFQRCYQQLAAGSSGIESAFYNFHLGPIHPAAPTGEEHPKTPDDLASAQRLALATTFCLLASPIAALWAYRQKLKETTWSNCWGGGHFSGLRWGGFLGSKLVAFVSILPLFGLLKGLPKAQLYLVLQLSATLVLLLAYQVVQKMVSASSSEPKAEGAANSGNGLAMKVAFALAAFSFVCTGNFIITWLQNYLGWQSESSNPLLTLVIQSSGLTLALWVLVISVLGPLAEELWYRAMLLPALGLLPSALLFALVHTDPRVFLPLAWTGLMFGWAYRRGGLLSSWLAHALWNGLVTLTLLGARGALG